MNALRGPVRLRTLTVLRWLAIAGQTVAIIVVHFGLGFATPLGLCIAAVAASAWVNIFTHLRYSPQRFASERDAAIFVAFDIAQLCFLLGFTGGLLNPFSALIIAPVTIAASFFSLRYTAAIAALALLGVAVLAQYHAPLPWRPGEAIELPAIYIVGVWAALSLSILFFAAYAHRIAAESAQMRSALAATQLVLDREQRLSALGGLAAAAAHELGTPLATIQLTAKEMARDLAEDDPMREDAELLVSQTARCRDILGRLSRHGEAGDVIHDRIGVETLLREAAEPFLEGAGDDRIRIATQSVDGAAEPTLRRAPEIIYGLRNFIENAVAYAGREVALTGEWTADRLAISIDDDGPGFSPEILARLGEPYVTARGASRPSRRSGGMGLGFFIAKTLIEGSGAEISFANSAGRGAHVEARWPLSAIVAPHGVKAPPNP